MTRTASTGTRGGEPLAGEHASTKLPRYKRPQRIHFMEQLPRTATGKVQRFKRLQLAESDLTGSLFRQILGRIERLEWHPT